MTDTGASRIAAADIPAEPAATLAAAPGAPPADSLRGRLAAFLDSASVQRLIVAVILFNAVILGLETSPSIMASFGPVLIALDQACLVIFVIEIVLKLVAHRLAFFRNPWNVFDFLVVGVALVPAAGELSVLRAFRVLRVFRLLTIVPSMRRIVSALFSALPGMGSVVAVLAVVFYVFAVMATKLFSTSQPERFGSLGDSLFTLFQVMTLEGWADAVVRPVMETHANAWIFFILFIMLTTFAVLNLFIGLIVNAMQQLHEAETAKPGSGADVGKSGNSADAALLAEVQALRAEIAALSARIKS